MNSTIKSLLTGVGQVMLQENAWTGLFFLLGIFYNSMQMGLGAIIGVILGTITAHLFKYGKKEIQKGWYGFNGTLIGIAMVFFFGLNPLSILFILIGAVLSSYVMHAMVSRKLTPYTFPFVLTTWLLILLISTTHLLPKVDHSLSDASTLQPVSAASEGLGQVMFQDNIVTGVLFAIGLFISSRVSALYGIISSILGMLIGMLFIPLSLINIGIAGFNAVLCGIAMAKPKFSWFPFLAIFLSILILYPFILLQLPALTFPFVLASWITLRVQKTKTF